MQGIDKLLKELDQAQKALALLDGALTTVEFDPSEPASIQAAISKMEGKVDACVESYSRNPMVKEMAGEIKANLAEQIQVQAEKARTETNKGDEHMDGTIFRKIENTINDLKWADMNTFDRHIKKLASLLEAEEVKGISDELVDLVDLETWLAAGEATQGGMVGSARLDWPIDPHEELGMTISLVRWLAKKPERAFGFCHTFYNSGGRKITSELQGMVAQVIVPFGRDYIDYVKEQTGIAELTTVPERAASTARKVFVVHGHDEATKEKMARFLSNIKFEPIILHEQASGNRTVIEKIEAHSDVGFAVVLLTPDDVGSAVGEKSKQRARQNVILELGYFVGKLGRSRVAVFKQGDVEVPSDFGGVVYIQLDGAGAWKAALGRELKEAGFDVDWNLIMK